MKEHMKLVTRIALVTGALGLTASCNSSKVYSVVPEDKPSAEEIAQIKALQETDTSGKETVETAEIQFKPVDLATDKSIAMAYAIPEQKPLNDSAAAMASLDGDASSKSQQQVQVASLSGDGAVTRTAAVMQDGYGSSDPSAATALTTTRSIEKSEEPFVSATKNTNLNQLIAKYAALYEVPEHLVHHVVRRESNYNPNAVNSGNWGLMQIRYNTARGLGYTGTAKGLLDAETNLKYAVKYLRGAWLVADKNDKKADMFYRTGYYYHAKRKNMLDEVGE